MIQEFQAICIITESVLASKCKRCVSFWRHSEARFGVRAFFWHQGSAPMGAQGSKDDGPQQVATLCAFVIRVFGSFPCCRYVCARVSFNLSSSFPSLCLCAWLECSVLHTDAERGSRASLRVRCLGAARLEARLPTSKREFCISVSVVILSSWHRFLQSMLCVECVTVRLAVSLAPTSLLAQSFSVRIHLLLSALSMLTAV